MVEPMNAAERALVRRRLEQWRAADPILREQRRQAVVDLSDSEGCRAALDLAASLDQLPPRPPRVGSGLVEQQRLFMRMMPT